MSLPPNATRIYNGWAATRGTATKLPGSIALTMNFNASDVQPRLLTLPDKAQAGFAFVRLVGGLSRLYVASPSGSQADGAQAAQAYANLERQIADAAGDWLRLNGNFLFAFNAKLHARTVALFLALASLAHGVAPDAPGLSFDDMFTVTLTRENQGATLVV
jgi:hypothetical protein